MNNQLDAASTRCEKSLSIKDMKGEISFWQELFHWRMFAQYQHKENKRYKMSLLTLAKQQLLEINNVYNNKY